MVQELYVCTMSKQWALGILVVCILLWESQFTEVLSEEGVMVPGRDPVRASKDQDVK